jgi:hypothetical protein
MLVKMAPGSILRTLKSQLLHQNYFAKKLQSQTVIREKTLLNEKAVC